jgi:hypothetical protein
MFDQKHLNVLEFNQQEVSENTFADAILIRCHSAFEHCTDSSTLNDEVQRRYLTQITAISISSVNGWERNPLLNFNQSSAAWSH